MKTINEKNKMILDFMEVKPRPVGHMRPYKYQWSDSPFFYCTEDTPEEVMEAVAKYAKYHSDWSWLMPVVRKIVEYSCNESEEAFMSDEYTAILDIIPLAIIEDSYRVVCEFIEWYNEKEKEAAYSCDNCGGGFIQDEMDFDVNDQDLCKNCSYRSFNDAPYGE